MDIPSTPPREFFSFYSVLAEAREAGFQPVTLAAEQSIPNLWTQLRMWAEIERVCRMNKEARRAYRSRK